MVIFLTFDILFLEIYILKTVLGYVLIAYAILYLALLNLYFKEFSK